MQKKLYVGSIEGNSVSLELNLEERANGKYQTVDHKEIDSYISLSISGDIRNGGGGQILDTLKEGLDEYAIPKEKLERILEIWEEYHLNGMNGGCKHQGIVNVNSENWKELAEAETKKCPYKYRYGSSWLVKVIPNEVIQEVKQLFEGEELIPEDKIIEEIDSEHSDERNYSIPSEKIIIKLEYKNKERNEYGFYNKYTVYAKNEKNSNEIDFEYSDSINNTTNKEVLHDELINGVLCCIKNDYHDNFETFEEFCRELGYNDDSIKDKELYHLIVEQSEKVRKIFNEDLVSKFPD